MKKIIILIIIIVLLIIFIYQGLDESLQVNKYRIKNKKVNNSIRIAHLSDFHAQSFKDKQDELVEEIEAVKPDLIFITGDIMREVEPLDNVELLITKIKNLAPIYYVTGNHEYNDEKLSELFLLLEDNGVNVLTNIKNDIVVKDNQVSIVGVNDPEGYNYGQVLVDFNTALRGITIDDNRLNLLLSHRPELVDIYGEMKYDIVFSGHAHGGQVRIPFLMKGLIAPNQGLFPNYTKGIYELENDVKMVVSAGLITNEIPRFYNNPELVVVDIVNE